MSDFGANTSDYASDFREGSSDYSSDFCDFPVGSDSDFTRDVRHSGSRTAGTEGPPGSRIDRAAVDRQPPEWNKRGGKLAAQAASNGAGENATPQGNNQGVRRTNSGGNIGTAPPN